MLDPDKKLNEIRILVAKVISGEICRDGSPDAGKKLAEGFHELDSWITSGGKLPRTWQNEE